MEHETTEERIARRLDAERLAGPPVLGNRALVTGVMAARVMAEEIERLRGEMRGELHKHTHDALRLAREPCERCGVEGESSVATREDGRELCNDCAPNESRTTDAPGCPSCGRVGATSGCGTCARATHGYAVEPSAERRRDATEVFGRLAVSFVDGLNQEREALDALHDVAERLEAAPDPAGLRALVERWRVPCFSPRWGTRKECADELAAALGDPRTGCGACDWARAGYAEPCEECPALLFGGPDD